MTEIKDSRLIKFACYAIPILLVIYVLSEGPVAAFICYSDGTAKHPEYIDLQESFYAPMAFVVTKFSWLDSFVRRYTKFWYKNFSRSPISLNARM